MGGPTDWAHPPSIGRSVHAVHSDPRSKVHARHAQTAASRPAGPSRLAVALAVLLALGATMVPAVGVAQAAPAAPAAVHVTATILPPLPGESDSRAWAISERGEVVGTSGDRAVKWVDGVPVALAAPADAEAPFEALGVADGGAAVGRDGFERFCVWGDTAMCATIAWGWSAYATDVNDAGVVVGGTDDEYAERGWYWNPATGPQPVLIEPRLPIGADAENSSTRVAAVNDAAQIAGTTSAWLEDGAAPAEAFVLAAGVPHVLDSPGGADSE